MSCRDALFLVAALGASCIDLATKGDGARIFVRFPSVAHSRVMGRGAATAISLPVRAAPIGAAVEGPEVSYLGMFSCQQEEIARGWRLPVVEVASDYRRNGKHASRMVERRVARALGGVLAPENAPHDLTLADGLRLEVRCYTSTIKFGPSGSIGSGRSLTSASLGSKLDAIDGYVLCDVTTFPRVAAWFVPAATVGKWRANGTLGRGASIAASKFHRLAETVPPAQLARHGEGGHWLSAEESLECAYRPVVRLMGSAADQQDLRGMPLRPSRVLDALATIRRAGTLAPVDQALDDAVVESSRFLLDALCVPEVLRVAGRTLSVDTVQSFAVIRVDEPEEILVDVATDLGLVDVVARYVGSSDKLPIITAFADRLQNGWVAISSPEVELIGYPLHPGLDQL